MIFFIFFYDKLNLRTRCLLIFYIECIPKHDFYGFSLKMHPKVRFLQHFIQHTDQNTFFVELCLNYISKCDFLWDLIKHTSPNPMFIDFLAGNYFCN